MSYGSLCLSEMGPFLPGYRICEIELFMAYVYYSFNAHGICSDVHSFISDIGNLCCFFVFLNFLAIIDFIDFFRGLAFGFSAILH